MHEKQRDFLLSCFPDSLFPASWFPDSLFFSLVNHELVSVGIAKLRHPANWRLRFLDVEHDTALFELRIRGIDIFNLESDGGSIARRLPRRVTTDSDRNRAKIILDPRAIHLRARRL